MSNRVYTNLLLSFSSTLKHNLFHSKKDYLALVDCKEVMQPFTYNPNKPHAIRGEYRCVIKIKALP